MSDHNAFLQVFLGKLSKFNMGSMHLYVHSFRYDLFIVAIMAAILFEYNCLTCTKLLYRLYGNQLKTDRFRNLEPVISRMVNLRILV